MASRNKLTLNKIKRIFKEIGKSIGEFFKKLWQKYKELPSKVKLIGFIWLIILIVIVVLITSSSSNNKTLKAYHEYETKINDAALKYVENNNYYGTRDNKVKVDLEELKDANLITEKDLPDNTCKGYSLTYYDDETSSFNSVSYINCKKYTSEDYYDYKS